MGRFGGYFALSFGMVLKKWGFRVENSSLSILISLGGIEGLIYQLLGKLMASISRQILPR